jgi:hypothetical protein
VLLKDRINLLAELGHFLLSGGDEELDVAIRQSYVENNWFTEENSRNALKSIALEFLDKQKLEACSCWWRCCRCCRPR